jgi:hypothetical protein
MTSFWGPLGWMTLHSASMLYSENPTSQEKSLMLSFIDAFGESISCHQCKTHFLTTKIEYEQMYPNYLNSKKDFMLFTFRVHNGVNKRLDKPILQTVNDCIQTLKNANSYSSLHNLRNSYISYLHRNWGQDFSSEGYFVKKKITELIRINNEYFNLREIDWSYTFNEDVLPIKDKLHQQQMIRINRRGGFKNGRLQF